MTSYKRLKQLLRFGWEHAGEISATYFACKNRVHLFLDILHCFFKYGIWSNQYVKEQIWSIPASKRDTICFKYKKENDRRERWLKDYYSNRNFFIKYGNVKYEKPLLREKRNRAYTKRYHAGKDILVEYDVNITRQHYLDGSISIGNHVLIAKHTFIDYSGKVTIKDHVQLANGVIIETHHHPFHSNPSAPRNIVQPTEIMIEEGAVIGSRAIILASCHYIGKNARIGAGAVVTKDVKDGEFVAGVPARMIRIAIEDNE